jgi:hypothetical protein
MPAGYLPAADSPPGSLFELLEGIGWEGDAGRDSFEVTMPAHDLMEVLQRLHGEAGIVLGDSEESREDAETKRRFRQRWAARQDERELVRIDRSS